MEEKDVVGSVTWFHMPVWIGENAAAFTHARLLVFIHFYIRVHSTGGVGVSVSHGELAQACGFRAEEATAVLEAMEAEGFLERSGEGWSLYDSPALRPP